jgi:hypothetical protein
VSAFITRRRIGALAATLLVGFALAMTGAGPAAAAGDVGYVRLAHLSPDTPDVDVYLTSVSAGGAPKVFPGVGYGTMSNYLSLPTGTYAVAMRAAGAPAAEPPVLTTNVTVAAGKAYTVAGVGRHADLGLTVIDDNLALPPADMAKVRILQASVKANTLDVNAVGGQEIASEVGFATTTQYNLVKPGEWTLKVQGANGGPSSTLACDLVAGNVYSLLVLDNKKGGLTAQLRVDAKRQGGVPNGGVETGGGGTAVHRTGTAAMLWWSLPVLVAVLAAAGFAVRRQRRVATR